MTELQADFLAGVWGYHENRLFQSLEEGDLEEAITTASVIGDDYLQKKAQGYVVPDAFSNVIDNMPKILALGGFKIVTLKAVYEAVTMICDMIDCYSESVCVYKKITELCDMIDFYSEL